MMDKHCFRDIMELMNAPHQLTFILALSIILSYQKEGDENNARLKLMSSLKANSVITYDKSLWPECKRQVGGSTSVFRKRVKDYIRSLTFESVT